MIDLDGVLADFTLGFTQLAYRLKFTKEPPHHTSYQTTWDYDFDVPKLFGVIKHTMNWWMTLETIPSEESIRDLNDIIQEHDIYFITSRPNPAVGLHVEMQSREWLRGIGVHIDKAHVIATKAGTKGMLCAGLNINIGIDDRPENIEELAEYDIIPIVRSWKYNEILGNRFTRVNNLTEFLEML